MPCKHADVQTCTQLCVQQLRCKLDRLCCYQQTAEAMSLVTGVWAHQYKLTTQSHYPLYWRVHDHAYGASGSWEGLASALDENALITTDTGKRGKPHAGTTQCVCIAQRFICNACCKGLLEPFVRVDNSTRPADGWAQCCAWKLTQPSRRMPSPSQPMPRTSPWIKPPRASES